MGVAREVNVNLVLKEESLNKLMKRPSCRRRVSSQLAFPMQHRTRTSETGTPMRQHDGPCRFPCSLQFQRLAQPVFQPCKLHTYLQEFTSVFLFYLESHLPCDILAATKLLCMNCKVAKEI